MSAATILGLVLAMLTFWAMGAYNRLMRLRSQGIQAFAVLEGLFHQYVLLVQDGIAERGAGHAAPETSGTSDPYSAAWLGLEAAAEQLGASLKVSRAQPFNVPTMGALRTAHDTLCLSWSRLSQLPPEPWQAQWEPLAVQVDIARSEFNRRVKSYNDAISQFPALLLAWVVGFKPAQPI